MIYTELAFGRLSITKQSLITFLQETNLAQFGLQIGRDWFSKWAKLLTNFAHFIRDN